jgi:hypothetical protein
MKMPALPPMPVIPPKSSGRMELAQWMTQPTHPLTSRVMVNRLWQHLFGEGIVRTPDDFGITGADPTHPELLDHLAIRFVEGGWSVKKMIRVMMLSRTYRLATTGNPEHPDAGNKLRWRQNPKRLELEPLRDTLLQLAGQTHLRPPRRHPSRRHRWQRPPRQSHAACSVHRRPVSHHLPPRRPRQHPRTLQHLRLSRPHPNQRPARCHHCRPAGALFHEQPASSKNSRQRSPTKPEKTRRRSTNSSSAAIPLPKKSR